MSADDTGADTIKITVRSHDITALGMLESALRRGDISDLVRFRESGLHQIRRILDAASDVYDRDTKRILRQAEKR